MGHLYYVTDDSGLCLCRQPQSGGLLGDAVDHGIVAVVGRLFKERPVLFWSNLLLGLLLGLYYLLSAIGLLSGRFDAPAAVLLLAVAAYFVLVSGGPAGENRFRLPIMPIVCLFAGAGLSVIWKRFNR